MKYIIPIAILAFILRLYGINWDNGYHLHPDERMLIMVADRIQFWSNLNPEFFNYGTLPIYLVKGVSQLLDAIFSSSLATYDNLLYVGRFLSILFDVGTLICIYKIARFLFKPEKVAVFSALFYSLTFFAIQNTHFFVVDVFLSFFVNLTLYRVLKYYETPSLIHLLCIGITLGAALATKITAIIFLPVILGVILYIQLRNKKYTHISLIHRFILFCFNSFLVIGTTIITHFIAMPYAYLQLPQFVTDTLLQSQMNSDAYIFPYTLQYVTTLPYLYYLKQIVVWGLGPFISILSIVGILFGFKRVSWKHGVYLIFVLFYLFYFLIIGRSAVKFMRYMLLLYPFFVILAGYGIYRILTLISNEKLRKVVGVIIMAIIGVWTLSFINIYSFTHTRIAATDWILKNIPKGAIIATEHWDDRVPIYGSEYYFFQDLTIYDIPDDEVKWQSIDAKLENSDYIVIASNRLHVPLQKLDDCTKYVKCYPKTSQYYKDLFDGKLGFTKIKEFNVGPTLPFLPVSFSDQSADESFTVYDHPKIMIFKKI